jgi:hypothetical protein
MRWHHLPSLRAPGTGAGVSHGQGNNVGALLVVGSVALSVVAGLLITRGLITLMLSALPSIPAIRPGAPDVP